MTIKGEAEWKQWTKRSKGSKVNKTRKDEIKRKTLEYYWEKIIQEAGHRSICGTEEVVW